MKFFIYLSLSLLCITSCNTYQFSTITYEDQYIIETHQKYLLTVSIPDSITYHCMDVYRINIPKDDTNDYKPGDWLILKDEFKK